jgi:hypothetical protein
MNKRVSILNGFINKGGLIGRAAQLYANDEKLGAQFLLELKEQLKTNKIRMVEIWGKELVTELEHFSEN